METKTKLEKYTIILLNHFYEDYGYNEVVEFMIKELSSKLLHDRLFRDKEFVNLCFCWKNRHN